MNSVIATNDKMDLKRQKGKTNSTTLGKTIAKDDVTTAALQGVTQAA